MNDDNSRASRAWPRAAWLLPLLSASVLALAFASLNDARRSPDHLAHAAARAPQTVEVWSGSVALDERATLAVRVATLRVDPHQQEFDTAALRQRLGRTAGEAWRCEVTLVGAPGDDSAAEPGTELTTELTTEPGPALTIEEIVVEDSRGRASGTLVDGSTEGSSGAVLRALFAPPSGALAAGGALEVWLWGRAPEEGATLALHSVGREPLRVALERASMAEGEWLRGLAAAGTDTRAPAGEGER